MPESRDLSRFPVSQGRVRVIEILQSNYAHGNLDMEELEHRLELANSARSMEEMLPLVSDLTDLPVKERHADSAGSVAINRGRVKESSTMVSILSGHSRKGAWKPPRRLKIFAFLGGVDLDFRNAQMAPGTTEISVYCLLGGVDIKVPPGLNVDVSGIGILGGFDDNTEGELTEEGPNLVVRGVALLGGLDVKVKPRKK